MGQAVRGALQRTILATRATDAVVVLCNNERGRATAPLACLGGRRPRPERTHGMPGSVAGGRGLEAPAGVERLGGAEPAGLIVLQTLVPDCVRDMAVLDASAQTVMRPPVLGPRPLSLSSPACFTGVASVQRHHPTPPFCPGQRATMIDFERQK